MKKNTMIITNKSEYDFWIEFFRTDSSIKEFTILNRSDYSGFEVEIEYEYNK